MWMEVLKDYSITILYHRGKANMVADALSKKSATPGSLDSFIASERSLAINFVVRLPKTLAYELALPPGLSGVHPVFHVFMLKRYHDDCSFIIRWDFVLWDENLSYEEEPIAILDREVRKLRSKEIASVKVQ
ncbi:uncharacterized protein LOC132054326 [Lycium ferocissimum]|uniref:uncharacterized protein LOC132054326 n=1 Tax=Lycium ferocissimum TaxID=112874 RepID=UPI0028157352|nr:uncharacterized protein LOC132054326 [Lycium ferocissimum]